MSLPTQAEFVLFVDDEEKACKWIGLHLSREFKILTARSMLEALDILHKRAAEVAVVITDYAMPGGTGVELLREVQKHYRHIVSVLASAHADKEVAIAAINEGRVFSILEKPFTSEGVSGAVRDALAFSQERASERVAHESRSVAMRETLGFLAHELNTPLSAMQGYTSFLQEHLEPITTSSDASRASINQERPGQIATMILNTHRSILHCQSLIATFIQSTQDANPAMGAPKKVMASSLTHAIIEEYPFEGDESTWIVNRIEEDFELPTKKDLLYLGLCTLTKNALQALRGRMNNKLVICVGCNRNEKTLQPWIKFEDNGPGIAPELLAKLTKESVTSTKGGNGIGLLFCQRVMLSIGGYVEVDSELNVGTTVTLYFHDRREA